MTPGATTVALYRKPGAAITRQIRRLPGDSHSTRWRTRVQVLLGGTPSLQTGHAGAGRPPAVAPAPALARSGLASTPEFTLT